VVPEPKRLDLTPEKYGKGNYLGGEVTPVPEPGAHTVRFDPKSRSRLTRRDIGRFPGETLFARVARAICEADYLPRKELFESWEVARRVRRRVRGRRVVEFASGHALVAHLLLLLDSTSESAVAIDAKPVPSADRVAQTLVSHWPRLEGRVERRVGDLAMVDLEAGDLVVSVHACGALSDTVLDRAIRAQAVVALLPCCQDAATCDTGSPSPSTRRESRACERQAMTSSHRRSPRRSHRTTG